MSSGSRKVSGSAASCRCVALRLRTNRPRRTSARARSRIEPLGNSIAPRGTRSIATTNAKIALQCNTIEIIHAGDRGSGVVAGWGVGLSISKYTSQRVSRYPLRNSSAGPKSGQREVLTGTAPFADRRPPPIILCSLRISVRRHHWTFLEPPNHPLSPSDTAAPLEAAEAGRRRAAENRRRDVRADVRARRRRTGRQPGRFAVPAVRGECRGRARRERGRVRVHQPGAQRRPRPGGGRRGLPEHSRRPCAGHAKPERSKSRPTIWPATKSPAKSTA